VGRGAALFTVEALRAHELGGGPLRAALHAVEPWGEVFMEERILIEYAQTQITRRSKMRPISPFCTLFLGFISSRS